MILKPPKQSVLSRLSPPLNAHSIHLYSFSLQSIPLPPIHYFSAEEQGRAKRYNDPEKSRRFLTSRFILKTLLGAYLGKPWNQISWDYTEQGKPIHPELAFNLSHSGERAVLAIALPPLQVGVDVENLKSRAWRTIGQRHYSLAECQSLEALDPKEQLRGFYRLWTAKEACLKQGGDQEFFAGLHQLNFSPADCQRLLADHPVAYPPFYLYPCGVNHPSSLITLALNAPIHHLGWANIENGVYLPRE